MWEKRSKGTPRPQPEMIHLAQLPLVQTPCGAGGGLWCAFKERVLGELGCGSLGLIPPPPFTEEASRGKSDLQVRGDRKRTWVPSQERGTCVWVSLMGSRHFGFTWEFSVGSSAGLPSCGEGFSARSSGQGRGCWAGTRFLSEKYYSLTFQCQGNRQPVIFLRQQNSLRL